MTILDREGFEIVPDVLDRGTVSSLTEAIGATPIHRSRAGIRHALEVDAVRALASERLLTQFAKRALGNDAVPFRATLFDKSPQSNWLVVWHQDTALPLKERKAVPGWGPWSVKEGINCTHAPASALEQVLAIRVHLDDSTSENGALRVLTRTHKMGVLSDETIHELAEKMTAVECHAASGGILLMRPLLVHASSKARNGASRRVLHIEYSATRAFQGGLELAI